MLDTPCRGRAMDPTQRFALWVCGLACLLGSTSSAFAQSTYRCQVNGRTYLSDRPCTQGAASHLGTIGPLQREGTSNTPMRMAPLGRAPDHLGRLSPACAQLNDAIRTAPARGVGTGVQRDLQAEYQKKCGEEDRQARKEVADAQAAESQARRANRDARDAARSESQRQHDQCQEMLRILHGKRQRMAAMTPGERADFERFESNYATRCRN